MTKGERKSAEGSELYADQGLKDFVVTHNKKEYQFKYQELTWAARNKILSESLSVDNVNRGHLDLDRYQRGCLAKMIKEHPFSEDLEVALIKLDDAVGKQLTKIVPSSRELIKEEEADFTGEPSEAQ